MPRVDNAGPEVDKYCEGTGEGSTTWDICKDCHHEVRGLPLDQAELGVDREDPPGVVGEDIGYGLMEYVDEDGRMLYESNLSPCLCERCNCQLTVKNY